MNMKNNCRFPEEKRQLFLLFLLKLITLRYVDLLYREILTREHSLFKASAVRTIALVLNDIEDLVTVVALGHTGDGLKNELCALKRRTLSDGRKQLLNILRDDER